MLVRVSRLSLSHHVRGSKWGNALSLLPRLGIIQRMHPNRVCRDQNRHNRASTTDYQSQLMEIQTPRYRQLARNCVALLVFLRNIRVDLRLTPQILHRRITRKVHHCPSQPRGSALVRPGASALIRSFLYVFKPPTFVNSVALLFSFSIKSPRLPYRIVSNRVAESQNIVLSY